jgi:hypothetical protein
MWYSRSSSVQSKQTELSMALFPVGNWRTIAAAAAVAPLPMLQSRSFRSDAALEALAKASQEKVPNLLLYNYPSFSGAFSALFAHLFHSRLNLPCLSLPFSSVEPFRSSLSLSLSISQHPEMPLLTLLYLLCFYRVDDLCIEGLERCYFLDFLGPKGFAIEFARRASCE